MCVPISLLGWQLPLSSIAQRYRQWRWWMWSITGQVLVFLQRTLMADSIWNVGTWSITWAPLLVVCLVLDSGVRSLLASEIMGHILCGFARTCCISYCFPPMILDILFFSLRSCLQQLLWGLVVFGHLLVLYSEHLISLLQNRFILSTATL